MLSISSQALKLLSRIINPPQEENLFCLNALLILLDASLLKQMKVNASGACFFSFPSYS